MTPETKLVAVGKHNLVDLAIAKEVKPWDDRPYMVAKVKTAKGEDAVLRVRTTEEDSYSRRGQVRVELDIPYGERDKAKGITRITDVPGLREEALRLRARHLAKFVPTAEEISKAAVGNGVADIGPGRNYNGDPVWTRIRVKVDGLLFAGVEIDGEGEYGIDGDAGVYLERDSRWVVKHDQTKGGFNHLFCIPERHRKEIGALLKPFVDLYLSRADSKKSIRAYEDENLERQLKSAEQDVVNEQSALEHARAKVAELTATIAKRKAEVDNG